MRDEKRVKYLRKETERFQEGKERLQFQARNSFVGETSIIRNRSSYKGRRANALALGAEEGRGKPVSYTHLTLPTKA